MKDIQNYLSLLQYISHRPSVGFNFEQYYKDGTSDWMGSDNKEAWDENIKTYSEYLQPYIDRPIKYKINEQYFRSDFDFYKHSDYKVNIFLGCSHTQGVGNYEEDMFTTMINNKIGYKQMNLGLGGHGMETAYYNLLKYITVFDVLHVFHYQPLYPRFSWVDRDGVFDTLSYNKSDEEYEEINDMPFRKEFIKNTVTSRGYLVYEYVKYINAIASLCQRKGVPYYYIGDFPSSFAAALDNTFRIIPAPDTDDLLARDCLHYSRNMNKEIADKFLKLVDKHPGGYIDFDIDVLDKVEVFPKVPIKDQSDHWVD
jgi:hypothetical protein